MTYHEYVHEHKHNLFLTTPISVDGPHEGDHDLPVYGLHEGDHDLPVDGPHEGDHDLYLLTAPMRVPMTYTC